MLTLLVRGQPEAREATMLTLFVSQNNLKALAQTVTVVEWDSVHLEAAEPSFPRGNLFPHPTHTSDLDIGTIVATLMGA